VARSVRQGRFYFPVQLVSRPGESGVDGARGYAGRIESGSVAVGDEVAVLPSGQRARVRGLRLFDRELQQAHAPQSITLVLDTQLDVSRGDVLVAAGSQPPVSREFGATLCWLADQPFNRGRRYLIKHGARMVRALFDAPQYRINVNTLEREAADSFALNDIGRVALRTAQPLAFEPYRSNRTAGSFIVIDEATNYTVAAGLIEESR
jgi:sulfate adenylyltransferase subunit 1